MSSKTAAMDNPLIKKKRSHLEKNWVGLMFFLPFFLFFVVFTILPVIVAIILSFTDYNMIQSPVFSGLRNYRILFTDDDIFILSLKNTFIFAIITGPVGYLMSFIMAWIINQLKFKTGFALAFYVPSVTSAIAMTTIWNYIFSDDRYGFINNILINIGLISEPILWKSDSSNLMTVLIIITLWQSMGTGFLVFLAGIQNINKELLESGRIDGIKTKFQELQYIILPSMKPQLLYGAITAITNAFGVFDVTTQVTATFPSPNYAIHTIVAHLYDYAFIKFQMGYAAAISVVLFAITFIIGRVVMRVLRTND